MSKIRIEGAREHNLKNVSVTLPRDKLIVITGLSGSGKSSLAFDTLYAEGQRRYVESLSAYARQFLQLMQKPDVDSIEGLSPAISIEQKTTSKNPRSTVGTITEIYDYLRLLFARIGVPYSPTTGLPIKSQTVSEMVDRIIMLPEGSRIHLMSPIIRERKGEYKKELQDLRQKGFQRVKIDGQIFDLQDVPTLNKNIKHTISVIVDRLVIKEDIGRRIAGSLETALDLSEGLAEIENLSDNTSFLLSANFCCPESGFTIEEIEPRLFSFNSPMGACPKCDGLGVKLVFDPDLVIPNPNLPLLEGVFAAWPGPSAEYYQQIIISVAKHYGYNAHSTSFTDLPENVQNVFLYGSGKEEIPIIYKTKRMSYSVERPFEGVIPNLERRWKETESERMREELGKFQSTLTCEVCDGHRLKTEALSIKINQKHIGEITELPIKDSRAWFQGLRGVLSEKDLMIGDRILKEIEERLQFLESVGLDYLTLSRMSGSLSGGESQRIRLASQIGSGLTGVLYVLDEPSIGLHQRDNDRLLATLKRLRDLGNTVVVVEHDEDAIRLADHVVDLGPRAGALGGEIVAEGTPQDIINSKESLTGQYLRGEKSIDVPKTRRAGHDGKSLTLKGATTNNLKDITAEFPLGKFICVTGVSGGGKSSLVIETLYKELSRRLNDARVAPAKCTDIEGLEHIDKIIEIDQSPIGRTPRSNPVTYTGIFTPVREWFARLPDAKARGYSPSRFSFNVKGGRCEACQGDGVIKIEMHFLPDVYVTCDVCKGKRYNRETLDIKFKGKSISDILEMTVDEAFVFFEATPGIRDKLDTLQKVGLGYIKIGQRATTLSGGEAQRIKLSKELSKRATGNTFYILDEPTTGLHFDDVNKLLEVLHHLVDQGNTVVVIEHNLDVIKTADWIIDLGPEGGNGGGYLVAAGTPEDIIKCKESHTGIYLKPYLK